MGWRPDVSNGLGCRGEFGGSELGHRRSAATGGGQDRPSGTRWALGHELEPCLHPFLAPDLKFSAPHRDRPDAFAKKVVGKPGDIKRFWDHLAKKGNPCLTKHPVLAGASPEVLEDTVPGKLSEFGHRSGSSYHVQEPQKKLW